MPESINQYKIPTISPSSSALGHPLLLEEFKTDMDFSFARNINNKTTQWTILPTF